MSFTFHCFCQFFLSQSCVKIFHLGPYDYLALATHCAGDRMSQATLSALQHCLPFNSLQVIMSRARHKCIQCDGSRHGRKDALCIALGAFDPCAPDRFRTHMSARAPPKQQSENTSNFDEKNMFFFPSCSFSV